jgi:NADH dehydrogenase
MKIIIIGAGFAGLKCAKKLSSLREHEITIFNKTSYTIMRPSLPDVAGGRVKKQYLKEEVSRLVPSNVNVKIETVTSIDLKARLVITSNSTYDYDLLVLAQGTQVNYFNFNQNLDKLYTLENIDDAERIRHDLIEKATGGKLKNVVISGAGFTGLELGANLYFALKEHPEIVIQFVEKSDTIISTEEPVFAAYVKNEMEKLGLRFHLKNTVKIFDGANVTLENGTEINNAMLIWTSGVKRAISITAHTKELPNGRLIVNSDLRLQEFDNVFAIGDCSAFLENGKYLRMAVNYSSMMGDCAGSNIKRMIQKKPLLTFKSFDPGWIMPVHHTSVGYAFNIKIKGRIGVFVHFFMMGIKNFNFTNLLAYLGYGFIFLFTKKYSRSNS